MEKTEYITREEAKMSHCSACSWYGTCTDETMCEDVKAILAIPAADVKPVVHGEWIELGKYIDGYNWRCSVCKRESTMAINFCPNCGADMRKEKKYGDCY